MNAPVEVIDDVKFLKDVFVEIQRQFKQTNYQPVLKAFIPTLENAHKQSFQSRRSPAGATWSPLAASSIRRKGHNQPLVESTKLITSLTSSGATGAIRQTTSNNLIFGTKVAYSSLHQTGTGFIPRREHVGIDNDTLQLLVGAIAHKTAQQLKEKT